jgi:cytochrome c biogenesis protein CcmG, thiol:disulfide interchange protein DsbE
MSAEPGSPTGGNRALRLAGRVLVLGLIGLFLAVLVYGVVTRSPNRRIDDQLAEARPVQPPSFELAVLERADPATSPGTPLARALTDGRVSLRELRGTPLVLNFWASWCLPCREEAPLLERTWRVQGNNGLLFVGLNMQDLTDDARAFLREFRISYLNVRDPSNRVARSWGVTGLPETFFLRADGSVVGHVIGVVSPRQLSDGIAAARSGRPVGALTGGERRPTR